MKKIVKIFCSNIFLFVLLFAIMLFFLFHFIYDFKNYFLFIYLFFLVLNFIFVIYILNKRQDPGYHISWLILILSFPGIGLFIYLFLNFPLITNQTKKKLKILKQQTKQYLISENPIKDDSDSPYINYMYHYGSFPIYQNTTTTYFNDGTIFFNDLIRELRKAKKTIFLEFYIIKNSYMWNQILAVLKEKVKENVEVRVLYDGMCSICLLPNNYPKKLRKLGIKCQIFSPIINIISTYQNHRDHRKLCIIDGMIAYTGGINLGDEYIHIKNRYGYWKDSAIKIKGEAVKTFTCTFLEMWNLSSKQIENFSKYLPNIYTNRREEGYVLPYVDDPFSHERISKNTYLHIIHTSKKYIHIITPYLVLDNELLNQLTYAAKRGIHIQIIMPHIPDKKFVYYLGRSYYEELLMAGIEIYEYLPGFTHAKILTSDSEKAVVGSTNLDYRSLYLQYESNIYLYQNPVITKIEEDFQNTKKECQKITIEDIKHYSIIKRLIGKILRLFSPLL